MKVIGAIIIIFTTTWIGMEGAKRLSERPRQLRQLKVAIQSLEAEMIYGLTPLALASERIARQTPKPISTFFWQFSDRLMTKKMTAFEAWEESICAMWNTTALLNSEREVMMQFGATLGQHDRIQQEKQIKMTLAHLERE